MRKVALTKFEHAAEQYGYHKRADGMWTDDAEILRGYGIAPNVYLSAEEACREEWIPVPVRKALVAEKQTGAER